MKNTYNPDIMIERDCKTVMIIDAKYKKYQSFGKTAEYGISRDDLYQMNTYLYRYGKENEPIIGLFVSPVPNSDKHDIHTFEHNPKHRIGLLNLDLQSANKEISKLHEAEQCFLVQIKELLAERVLASELDD